MDGNQILLTNKKSLLECDESVCIKEPSDATKGLSTIGVISKISELGIQVHFFNRIKGLVPMSVLVKQGVTDPEDAFSVGQIVKCVVLSLTYPNEYKGKQKRRAKPRIVLSLDLGTNSEMLYEAVTNTSNGNDAQKDDSAIFVNGTIIKNTSGLVSVRLDDGRLASIEMAHVCDFNNASQSFLSAPEWQTGQRVEGALVLSSGGKMGVMLTKKPLLIAAAKIGQSVKKSLSDFLECDDIYLPSAIHDLLPGQVLAGYIYKVESYGVLVRFRNGLSALAPRPNIADKFTATPVGLFEVGDSVRCVVQRVDSDKGRIVITLKPALVPSTGASIYFSSLTKENYFMNFSNVETSSLVGWTENPIGNVVTAHVTAVKEYGVVLLSHDKKTVMLAQGMHAEPNARVGTEIKVRVLDMSWDKKVMDVSMHDSMMKFSKKSLRSGELVEGKIVLVKQKYLVVSLPSGELGFVVVADFHCPYLNTTEYSLDSSLTLKFIGNSADGDYPHSLLQLFVIHDEAPDGRREIARLQREADEADQLLHSRLSIRDGANAGSSSTDSDMLRQKFLEGLRVGGKHCWIVQQVTPVEVILLPEYHKEMGLAVTASAHVSCAIDASDAFDDLERMLEEAPISDKRMAISKAHPFYDIKPGYKVWCRIMQVRRKLSDGSDKGVNAEDETDEGQEQSQPEEKVSIDIQLALLPKVKRQEDIKFRPLVQWKGRDAVKMGGLYAAAVVDIYDGTCKVALSPYVNATLQYFDVSSDARVVGAFKNRYAYRH